MRRYRKKNDPDHCGSPEKPGYYIINPGTVKFKGEYLLLVDVFHCGDDIVFRIARNGDTCNFWFDPKLLNWSQEPTWKTEKGVYNPCTTQFNYEHIFSCSIYDNMLGTCIASGRTRDFKTSEFTSVSSEINNRNIALFPEKIDGLFCHQDHPRQRRTPSDNMRMSFSPEFINRGEGHAVMTTCLGHGD